MKLTKKLEAEVLKSYHTYWDSYLNGDMETFASLLDEHCHIIGSTEFDVFENKKSAVEFYTATAGQVSGKTEFRNRKITLIPYSEDVMVQELCDFYLKHPVEELGDDEWSFYGHGRLSTLFQKRENGWKIIHQHGSLPDYKAEEGEQFAIEKISKENLQLRDAVKRRTIELENKTRELEIETALERVRTAAMAMQKPDNMVDVCKIISEQLISLGVNDIRNVQTAIINESRGTYLNYQYFTAYDKGIVEDTEYNKHPKVFEMVRAMRGSADAFFGGSMEDEELQTFREWRKVNNQFPDPLLDEATAIHYNFYSIGLGGLGLTTYKPLPQAGLEIFKRFHNVFTLAYRRFIDIELAFAQAREAQIEAALEKVRSRSLAMHKPEELQEVVSLVFEKLRELNVVMDSGGAVICTYFKDSKDVLQWIASPDFKSTASYYLPYFDHPIFNETWNSKDNYEEFFAKAYSYEEKNSFFGYAFEHSDYKNFPDDFKKWLLQNEKYSLSAAWSKNSAILIPSHTGILPTEDDREILIRFAKVFEQAYIRFMDMRRAEAQAREAQIEAALEKIRSSALAMQTSQQLKDVASELRNQMRLLGQEDLEVCAIHLYDVDENYFESWGAIRTRDGKEKLFEGNARFPKSGVKIVDEMMQHYHMGTRDYVLVNEKEKAKEWIAVLKECSPEAFEMIRETIAFQKTEDLRVYWSLADFDGGAMLMVTYSEPDDSSRDMLRRTANVFELAYRRFQDLQTAEAHTEKAKLDLIQIQTEKKRAEEALAELQATQKQLIHAEKMASLGELTAGIAHEIQNPLNFVNNFSEVSVDIVNDLNEEMEKGNLEEVKAIVGDLKQNLEKISHHGKRASGIVKGMLEHSRTNTGQKEPTDINALADEYLRLAYHGLRAKNKSFNADFKTELDESLPNIKVIPQDIGRVLLNLINNAFYAVSERAKQNENGYRPVVSVLTKNQTDKIEISVKDNGNGVPESIRDKIFQPFFTTKPTGLGTGLGLSMSYDIITKGHGGEINLTSNQEGTIFTIILNIQNEL